LAADLNAMTVAQLKQQERRTTLQQQKELVNSVSVPKSVLTLLFLLLFQFHFIIHFNLIILSCSLHFILIFIHFFFSKTI